MRLIDLLTDRTPPADQRAAGQMLLETWGSQRGETIGHSLTTYASEGMAGNGPVFALIATRLLLFSEARFKFRNPNRDLFGTPALRPIENPWPGGTTRDLLAWMELDVSLGGNFYAHIDGGRLWRWRPDRVTIVGDADGNTIDGYVYRPFDDRPPIFAPVEQVVHYAPYKDPTKQWRGMSWLTPVAREVDADTAMTRHKNQFFTHAATPNAILKVEGVLDPAVKQTLQTEFDRRYTGAGNAYKTVLLEGGVDFEVVGSTFEQMSFETVQAAGESRLAAAAGVPPVIVGFTKGLESATYSNYQLAARRFADATLRPLWGFAADALAKAVQLPDGAELWYDDRYIPFLQQDAKDESEIRRTDAATIEALIRAGYTPATVVDAVTSGDFSRLQHSGLVSVQLKPPGVTL